MKIRIWGARGSIPSPLKPEAIEEKICRVILGLPDHLDTRAEEAVRAYVRELSPLLRGTAGGNTACVEIQAGQETLIVDAGSGLRELGLELMKGRCGQGQGVLHLFFSHPHWDHIQGFPFFMPAFIPGNRLFIYSVHDLQTALDDQQRPLNFPVPLSLMRANIEFIPVQVGQPFSIGSIRINTIQNAHPGHSYAYRFEDQHSVFVYASDAEYQQLDEASVRPHIEFFRNADALIFDAQYTLKEAWQKVDWGHSSAMIGVDLARAAGVKKLLLFHHDPTYSDAQLEDIQATALTYQAQDTTRPTCEVIVAYEGLTLDLIPPGAVAVQLRPADKTTILTPFDERGVDRLAQQLAHLAEQETPSGSIVDLSQVETLSIAGLKALLTLSRQRETGPLVLAAPSPAVAQVIKLGGYTDYFAIYPTVAEAVKAVQARYALNLPGQMISDQYRIVAKLGEGRLGTVLKVTDLQQKRITALRILSPTFGVETIDRFASYVHLLFELEHRHIARIYDCDWSHDGNYTFIVEELLSGPTLHERLADRDQAMAMDEALDIAVELMLALEYAHSRGVIHGHLKPQDIFLTAAGVKMCGFGLGRLAEGRNLLEAPLLHLAAAYLAPEQIRGQPLDARTDLYAAGVILYQLFTGRLPFEGTDWAVLQAHLTHAPPAPRELNPDISPFLEHLILKLLAKNPNDRYASAQQTRRISSSLVIGSSQVTRQQRQALIDREQPLQALQAAWAEAAAGRGRLAFITGEPGIGKTSLAQQAALQSEVPVLLSGRCQELEGSPVYHPFAEALRAYFATVPPEFLAEEARPWLSNLSQLVPEIRQVLPDLPDPPALEPKQEQLRLLSSLTQFIRYATQKRPWLFILDDLQWADQGSLELLRYLGRHLPSTALLIIGAYRDIELEAGHPLLETLHELNSFPTYRRLALNRLDQDGVGELLANIWRQTVPTALVEKIYQRTEGNPLYVEEVAKSLVDEGLITWREGAWHFPALAEVRLPQNVQEVVLRRVSHVSPDTQTLLRQAAVLGQTFNFDDLREMSALSEWKVLEHLDVALERQLLRETSGEHGLCFSHAEIQHVIYTALPPLRRRLLHRQAGAALERRLLSERERRAEALAYHFGEAGEFEKASTYSFQAAQRAQTAYNNEAALHWYHRTLAMLDRLGPEKSSQLQSLRLLVYKHLGEVLQLVGQWAEARKLYEDALALAEPLGDLSVLAWYQTGLGEVHRKQGLYPEAWVWFEQARVAFESLGDQVGVANSFNNLGLLAFDQGDYTQARHQLEEAMTLWREVGDRHDLANTLENLANVSRAQGDYKTARSLYTESLSISQELGDKWLLAYLLEDMGGLAALQGQAERALRLAGAAEMLRETIGAPNPPPDKEKLERMLAPARQNLGEAAAVIAIAEGRAMSLEQAIDYALQVA